LTSSPILPICGSNEIVNIICDHLQVIGVAGPSGLAGVCGLNFGPLLKDDLSHCSCWLVPLTVIPLSVFGGNLNCKFQFACHLVLVVAFGFIANLQRLVNKRWSVEYIKTY